MLALLKYYLKMLALLEMSTPFEYFLNMPTLFE